MIYLDNAATSFPKPESVYTATTRALRECAGNPSRSGHEASAKSSDAVYECRETVAGLFGARTENVVFTQNATHSLNIAIKGVAKEGAHFIISNIEHNAVLRPIIKLCEDLGCSYDTIDVLTQNEYGIIAEIKKKIRSSTVAVIMNHCSNLCPVRTPIRQIGAICQKEGIVFIVDASQSAGHIPIDISKDKINFLCAPGHKGLFGIMGVGILISDGKYTLGTLTEGGSGYNSSDSHMPIALPERLEAGTLPVPAIASLRAGCTFIDEIGLDVIRRHEESLFLYCRERLLSFKPVKIYRAGVHGSCLLFNLDFMKSDEVGELLSDRGICVRSGFHCAPLAHSSIKTGEYGAVRVSFSIFNTKEDVDALYGAVREICAGHVKRERR